jgi:ubiquinone/menaquinone biosynthesis C-methylase UbiE
LHNKTVKEQFNKQAEKFANWSVGKNIEYLQAYFDFCNLSANDKVLDVACGPGEFAIFLAQRVSEAHGIDISEREIEIAVNRIRLSGLNNIHFFCDDVENLPFHNNSYSVVLSKSAFHHFVKPDMVFDEMMRCCETGGKISLQDIVAYEDSYVNDFFETFDKLVDPSHNKTLAEREFKDLYIRKDVTIIRDFRLNVDLNVKDYIDHAWQDKKGAEKINRFLEDNRSNNRISEYLFFKDDQMFFRRPVFLILGVKK